MYVILRSFSSLARKLLNKQTRALIMCQSNLAPAVCYSLPSRLFSMTSFNNNNHSIGDVPASHYMKLQIQYGSDLYEIMLTSKDHRIRVEHVLDEIEKITKVPKCHQNVLYKGQRLDQKPHANLDDLHVFNNSKLILTGTQKSCHDKYCCPDHDHQINTILPKTPSIQQQTTPNRDNLPVSSTSVVLPKKQDMCPNVIGFVPEPNKTYEYYTVPYKIDPSTLLQTIPPSTSHA